MLMLFAATVAAAAVAWLAARRRTAVLRVGVDIVEVAGVEAALASARARRYLALVYTESEQGDCAPQGRVDARRLA
ncbi:MAG: hypothetical protein ACXVRJ_15070, partial [Gaiellaceae bacterium]